MPKANLTATYAAIFFRLEIIKNHILPALSSSATPPSHLPRLLVYALRQSILCPSLGVGGLECLLVEGGARLLGADGDIYTLCQGNAYGPAMALNGAGAALHLSPRLRMQLPGTDFVPCEIEGLAVVSDEYLEDFDLQDGAELRALVSLLVRVGVDWFPVVRMTEGERRARGSNSQQCVVIDGDWGSTALAALLAALCRLFDSTRLTLLAAALADRWQVLREQGATRASTPLMTLLTSASWLPGSDGTLHRPLELWLRSEQLEALLGDSVPYSVTPLPRAVADQLGIQVDLSTCAALSLLEAWAHKEAGHVSTLQRMSALYTYIHRGVLENPALLPAFKLPPVCGCRIHLQR